MAPVPPVPPLIAPLLVSVVIVAVVERPRRRAVDRRDSARAAGALPLIVPLLVSVVIVPEFDYARAARRRRGRDAARFRR